MININDIIKLKEEGNEYYKKALKLDEDDVSYKQILSLACSTYANCIEKMLLLEDSSSDTSLNDEFHMLKATLFLNIAVANMKLNSFEGCCRCCNVVIAFCNKPTMKLSDMGIDDDMTIRISIIEPVIPAYVNLAVKALYRRGKSLQESGYLEEALVDFKSANRISPDTKCINDSIIEVNRILNQINNSNNNNNDMNMKNEKKDNDIDLSIFSLSPQEIIEMTKNGGPCWMRLGYWSQSIKETRVYLPISDLMKLSCQSNDVSLPSLSSSWIVEFEKAQISIYLNIPNSSKECILQECLEYNINVKECIWMLESYESRNNMMNNINNYLVLYLSKVPSLEWFPGCEWWDRVLVDDEPIETMTCSIDTDITSLPLEARDRAQKEYDRFSSLSPEAQKLELSELSSTKKAFWEVLEKVKDDAELEEKAIQEVPERGALLSSLRKQFPNIDFTAR